MTLTACTNCGTNTNPGTACPRCGTPTPSGTAPSASSGYLAYWQTILERLQRAASPKYEVNGILGYGGMAGVFLAQEPRLGRNVAIKVMSPALMIDPNLVVRFEQEARTIALLSHPNIVTIFEVDQRDDLHWFAMAHVPGRTLGEVMTDATEPLPIPVVGSWLYQISDALAYAHHQGVVHRDIKPGNVLLDLRGNALVTDFGIAKVADGDTGNLTRTGMLVGTPTYMSPEQCSSGRVTGASDQYSLGAVIYQMLTGSPPFVGPTLAVIQAHLSQHPTPIQDVRPECPDNLADAVHRMLAKAPEERWPTMSAAIEAAGAAAPGFDSPVRKHLEELATPTAGIQVQQSQRVMREGERSGFTVSLTAASGRVLSGRRITWKSSDTAVAAVDEDELRALSPGSTEIVVSSGAAQAAVSVTIEPDPIGDISVRPVQVSVAAGATTSLEAIVLDIDGTRLDDRAVLWRSSNPSVARVSVAGVVEGVEPGQALVAARTGGKYATATVTVTASVGGHPSAMGHVTRATPAASRASVEVRSGGKPQATAPTAGRPSEAPARARSEPRTSTAPGKNLPAMIGAGVVALVLVVLLVLQPWKGSGGDTPSPAGTQAALSVTPNLPAGGSVTARDAFGGSWRLSSEPTKLAPGSYSLEFSAPGYEDSDSSITLLGGETLPFAPRMQRVTATPTTQTQQTAPAAVPDGSIAVGGTLPAGALVTAIDTSGQGTALRSIPRSLPPGRYLIEFRGVGVEPVDTSVNLRSGQALVWSPRVREIAATVNTAPREGTLEVRGTLPAGGTFTARDSAGRGYPVVGQRTALPQGTYTLEFRAPGFETETRPVTVRAGQTETWTPAMRAVTKAPPVSNTNLAADQAAIQNIIREFQGSFNRRDVAIIPLLSTDLRPTWQAFFQNRGVSGFSATLGEMGTPQVTGDNGSTPFTLNVAFRSGNTPNSSTLRFQASTQRTAQGWRITSVANQRAP